jgi:hypothetical protein
MRLFAGKRRTWGQGITIGTPVIAWDGPDQLGQGLLIALLLALTDATRHDEGNEWTAYTQYVKDDE